MCLNIQMINVHALMTFLACTYFVRSTWDPDKIRTKVDDAIHLYTFDDKYCNMWLYDRFVMLMLT